MVRADTERCTQRVKPQVLPFDFAQGRLYGGKSAACAQDDNFYGYACFGIALAVTE